MDSHWDEVTAKLKAVFPESDSSILAALWDQGDVMARYLAQIHEVTISEVKETMELLLGVPMSVAEQAIAAE